MCVWGLYIDTHTCIQTHTHTHKQTHTHTHTHEHTHTHAHTHITHTHIYKYIYIHARVLTASLDEFAQQHRVLRRGNARIQCRSCERRTLVHCKKISKVNFIAICYSIFSRNLAFENFHRPWQIRQHAEVIV